MARTVSVPLVIRGEVVDDGAATHEARSGDVTIRTPDVMRYMDRLCLQAPSALSDLHTFSFDEIVDYLARLGDRLRLSTNDRLSEACEAADRTSALSSGVLRHQYELIPDFFRPAAVREVAERRLGIDYLEGWVEHAVQSDPQTKVRVRAFGSRCVHVIAGNSPVIAALTFIRNAITRSDAIIKCPSNDVLTAPAIAQTMIDMEPHHPLTKHVAVAYWKGGDSRIENVLYNPRRVEKIVAWGGLRSVQNVTTFIQPGLELITLDPKHSISIIGPEAFESEETLRSVVERLALDIGTLDQEACYCTRVVYLVVGTDPQGLLKANELGALAHTEIQKLPSHLSAPRKEFDPELRAELDAARLLEEEFQIYGGRSNEGAIIVSQRGYPVDFASRLSGRVANIVPVEKIDHAIRPANAYTQTVSIFPDALKSELRDRLALQGVQRIVPLGGAGAMVSAATPQDGIEPVRRMCKWVVEECPA